MSKDRRVLCPEIAKVVGANAAIIFEQIHYWLGKNAGEVKDGKRWIYNTLERWQIQFEWLSVGGIRKNIKSLERQGFIDTKQIGFDRKKWYTINYDHPIVEMAEYENPMRPKVADACATKGRIEALQSSTCKAPKRAHASVQKGRMNNTYNTQEITQEPTYEEVGNWIASRAKSARAEVDAYVKKECNRRRHHIRNKPAYVHQIKAEIYKKFNGMDHNTEFEFSTYTAEELIPEGGKHG